MLGDHLSGFADIPVELHGGQVTACSEGVNSGATFIVELPLVAFSQAATQPANRSPARSV